jgi:hypothetical protein
MKPIYLKNLYDEEWLEMAFQLEGLAEKIREAVQTNSKGTAQALDGFISDPKANAVLVAARDFAVGGKGAR